MPATVPTAADATLGKLTLRVRGPAGTTQTVALTSACCRIGSGDDCTLRLRAPGIREVHCIISRGHRRTVVRGLAKETWLNGAVFFESPLSVGDCLRLGRLEIDVLADERIAEEADVAGPDEHRMSSQEAGASLPDSVGGDPLSADSASANAAELSLPQANSFDQLRDLVAGQTAEAASFAADALEKVRGVEDSLGERLGKLEDQSRQLEQAMNDLRALRSASEDEGRQWRAEHQAAEATWRQSLGDLDRRVNELVAAPVVPLAGAPGTEPAADWRQFDDRLAVLERLVGQEDQHHAKRSQELEGVLARLAQVEAAVARNEASDQEVESRLTQVERLEIQLAELTCQQATSGQLGTSLQQAWDEWRDEWPRQWTRLSGAVDDLGQQTRTLVEEFRRHERDHSVAQDELQRWCASLETQLAAARSHDAVRRAGTDPTESPSSPFDEVDQRHAPDQEPSDDPPCAAAAEAGSSALEEPKPEELSFEPVSKQAPLSTLDVLRRMGASVDFSDDEESPVLPPRAPARPAPAHPAAERPKTTTGAGHAERQGGQHEDGEAIEEYMSQLLQRMRSPNAETTQSVRPSPVTEPAEPRPPQPASESVTPAVKPLPTKPSQFVPRAPAPELAAGFSAMRALANNTARQAIDTHHRHRQVQSTRGKLVVAAIALVLSFALLWVSTGGSRLALWFAIASLLVSIYWGSRYILLTRRLRTKAEKGDRSDAEPASEAPAPEQTAAGGWLGLERSEAPAEVPSNVLSDKSPG